MFRVRGKGTAPVGNEVALGDVDSQHLASDRLGLADGLEVCVGLLGLQKWF